VKVAGSVLVGGAVPCTADTGKRQWVTSRHRCPRDGEPRTLVLGPYWLLDQFLRDL